MYGIDVLDVRKNYGFLLEATRRSDPAQNDSTSVPNPSSVTHKLFNNAGSGLVRGSPSVWKTQIRDQVSSQRSLPRGVSTAVHPQPSSIQLQCNLPAGLKATNRSTNITDVFYLCSIRIQKGSFEIGGSGSKREWCKLPRSTSPNEPIIISHAPKPHQLAMSRTSQEIIKVNKSRTHNLHRDAYRGWT